MDNKLLIAIGYPLGAINIHNEVIYQIQVNNKIFKMNVINYYTWRIFSSILDIDKAYELINNTISVNKEEFKESIDNLINQGLIISFDINDTSSIYEKLKKHVILRQGCGIGLRNGKSNYMIRIEKEIEVELNDYLIWINADGHRNIESLIFDYEVNSMIDLDKIIESFLESILFLYASGLVYFTEVTL